MISHEWGTDRIVITTTEYIRDYVWPRYSLAVNQLMVVTTDDWENLTQQKTSGELMYSSIMYNHFRWCLCSYKRLLPLYTCSISLFGTLIFLVCHQSLSTTLIEQLYWWIKLVYLMNTRIPIFGWQASLISSIVHISSHLEYVFVKQNCCHSNRLSTP